jgi:hypothetical protein
MLSLSQRTAPHHAALPRYAPRRHILPGHATCHDVSQRFREWREWREWRGLKRRLAFPVPQGQGGNEKFSGSPPERTRGV